MDYGFVELNRKGNPEKPKFSNIKIFKDKYNSNIINYRRTKKIS